MMYLVSTFAAGAAAIEIRNLAVDDTAEKIQFNGHGFADGDIVLSSAAIGGGTAANTAYVVDSKTTNDFKLKTFKAGATGNALDAAGNAAVTFTDATGGAATLSKFGAKKCKIASSATSDNKVTCAAAPGFAITDELAVYCTDLSTADACKLDGNVEGKTVAGAGGALNTGSGQGHLGHLDKVWATAATGTAFQLAKKAPTDGAFAAGEKIVIAADAKVASQNAIWLLSKDTGSVYAAAPKTLAADGGKWDVGTFGGAAYGGSATAAIAVCGNAECGVTDGVGYWYTAGSAATAGLTDKNVYWIDGGKGVAAPGTPYSFKLNKVNATGVTLAEGTAQAVTGSGKGDTYQRIDAGDRLTGSETTGNKIVFHGDKASTYVQNAAVIFWCSDTTTAADCDYKVTGMTNGAQFKIKSVATTKAVLKATTGADGCTTACADVAVTADSSTKTKGYLLKKNAETATVFPAAAAGSAARSFAMLGSAVAMATAFLLA